MSSRRDPESWPSRAQELMLRAALVEGPEATAAWRELRPELDIDVMEPGSVALIPLVYRSLVARGLSDPDLGRMKGIYRRAWYENNVAFRQLEPALARMNAAGSDVLLLGSAAVLLRHHHDMGLRRLPWIDLLVPPADEQRLSAALAKSGHARIAGARYGPVPFRSPGGRVVFVRTQPPDEIRAPEGAGHLDDAWWSEAVSTNVGGAAVLTLSAADQLVYSCALGRRPTAWTRVDWVVDALTILCSAEPIDWDRASAQVVGRRLVLRVETALRYLTDTFDGPEPAALNASLRESRIGKRDMLAHRLEERQSRLLGNLPLTAADYLRLSSGFGADGPVRYLQRSWELDRRSQLPVAASRKLIRAARRALPKRASAI